jgi:hypothetical protein
MTEIEEWCCDPCALVGPLAYALAHATATGHPIRPLVDDERYAFDVDFSDFTDRSYVASNGRAGRWAKHDTCVCCGAEFHRDSGALRCEECERTHKSTRAHCFDCGGPLGDRLGLVRCARCDVALRQRRAAERVQSDRELLPGVLRAWAALHDGRAPTTRERDQELAITNKRAKAAFGSWRALVQAAGLTPHDTGRRLTATPAVRLPGPNRQTVTGLYGAADGGPPPKTMHH